MDNELVEVAIQCLSSAFHVDPLNPQHFADLGVRRCASHSAPHSVCGGEGAAAEELLVDRPKTDSSARDATEKPEEISGGSSGQSSSRHYGEPLKQQQLVAELHGNGVVQRADETEKDTGLRESGGAEVEGGTCGTGGRGEGGVSRVAAVDAAGSGGGSGSGSGSGRMDVESKLEEFLAGLEAAGFYAGAPLGSAEYERRQQRAVGIFHHCTCAAGLAQVSRAARVGQRWKWKGALLAREP